MTDIEQREPVAWLHPTAGWTHKDRDSVNWHCAKAGPYPIPLYTGQQLAEVEARAISAERDRCNEIVRAAWGANVSIEGLDRATTAEAEAERLRALVEEAKRVLEPFSEALDSGEGNEREGSPIWESPCAMAIDFRHLRAARALRDRLGAAG